MAAKTLILSLVLFKILNILFPKGDLSLVLCFLRSQPSNGISLGERHVSFF
ncbi:hypothetical protein AAZX31_15G239800 [Glycine max]